MHAYHFIPVNVVNLLPAVDDSAVHSHGLVDEAQRSTAVEAILWAVVDAAGLFNSWILQSPWLLTWEHKGHVLKQGILRRHCRGISSSMTEYNPHYNLNMFVAVCL